MTTPVPAVDPSVRSSVPPTEWPASASSPQRELGDFSWMWWGAGVGLAALVAGGVVRNIRRSQAASGSQPATSPAVPPSGVPIVAIRLNRTWLHWGPIEAELRAAMSPAVPTSGASAAAIPDEPSVERPAVIPVWVKYEDYADNRVGLGNNNEAVDSLRQALDETFSERNVREWSESRTTQPDAPMPYAEDVARLRSKLIDNMLVMAKAGDGKYIYWLNNDLDVLGPELWSSTVAQLIDVTQDPNQLMGIANELENFVDTVRYSEVPGFYNLEQSEPDFRQWREGWIRVLSVAVDKVAAQAEVEPVEAYVVADAYKSLFDIIRAQDGVEEWSPNSPDTGLTPRAKAAGDAAVRYYLDAIDAARVREYYTAGHHRSVLKILDHYPGDQLDIVPASLRRIYEDKSVDDINRDWSYLADRYFNATPKPLYVRALDAATQYYIGGSEAGAEAVLEVLFKGAPVERVVGPFSLGSRRMEIVIDVVAAAMYALNEKGPGHRVGGFDSTQIDLANWVDHGIRVAQKLLGVRKPYLPQSIALSTNIPPDVQLSAALAEVIRSKGNAPAAVDKAVGLLVQQGGVGAVDRVELRRALSGEPVEGPVVDTLARLMPRHLKESWRQYREGVVEKAATVKSGVEKAEERSEERRAEIPIVP